MDSTTQDMTDETNGLITRMSGWILHPYNNQQSAVGWFFFVGLVIIAAYAWTRVLADIREI